MHVDLNHHKIPSLFFVISDRNKRKEPKSLPPVIKIESPPDPSYGIQSKYSGYPNTQPKNNSSCISMSNVAGCVQKNQIKSQNKWITSTVEKNQYDSYTSGRWGTPTSGSQCTQNFVNNYFDKGQTNPLFHKNIDNWYDTDIPYQCDNSASSQYDRDVMNYDQYESFMASSQCENLARKVPKYQGS